MNENVMPAKLSPMNERKRKMLLALPLIVIPFLTLAFWALGGGRGELVQRGKSNLGLNLQLPDPKMKSETLDKLGFYNQADKDSLKRMEAMRNDPFYSDHSSIEKGNELEALVQNSAGSHHSYLAGDEGNTASNPNLAEQRLMQKLAELDKAINEPEPKLKSHNPSVELPESNMEGLKRMMQFPDAKDEGDTELHELNDMMDKIIRIQHPESLQKKPDVQKDSFVKVSASRQSFQNGFYSIEEDSVRRTTSGIRAVVAEGQTLVNGAVIKLRLTSDLFIAGEKIPSGTFVYGTTSLNGERLEIYINSIRCNGLIYPVKLEVFDLDGLPGIYVPGAITREVTKQSLNDNINNATLSTLDPSVAAQATAAGITTLKNLLSKRLKQVKVYVKGGYQLLIKNKDA